MDSIAYLPESASQAQSDVTSAVVCPVHDTVMQHAWITYLSRGNVRSVNGLRCAVRGCFIYFDPKPRGGFFVTRNDVRERLSDIAAVEHLREAASAESPRQ